MEFVQKIDGKCAEVLPYYSDITNYTTSKYKESFECLNNLYLCSNNKVKNVKKVSKQFQNDLFWMLSQAADDLLELMETKFEIESPSTKLKGKTQRLLRIYSQLKEHRLLAYVQRIMEINENLLNKGKDYHKSHMVPLFLRVKATVEVSREVMMEIFAARVSELRMTYKCSKDSVTLFWSGQFKEEQIIEKIKDKFGCLKQFTVSFVQKGMEIKISRDDLTENYHHIMEKLSEMLKEAGDKSVSQWTETKVKTIDLYETVLKRIKEREQKFMIKAQPARRQIISLEIEKEETSTPTDVKEESIVPETIEENMAEPEAEAQPESEPQSQPESEHESEPESQEQSE